MQPKNMSIIVIRNGEYVELSPCFFKLDDLGLPDLEDMASKKSSSPSTSTSTNSIVSSISSLSTSSASTAEQQLARIRKYWLPVNKSK